MCVFIYMYIFVYVNESQASRKQRGLCFRVLGRVGEVGSTILRYPSDPSWDRKSEAATGLTGRKLWTFLVPGCIDALRSPGFVC